jgi:hypothetical protein
MRVAAMTLGVLGLTLGSAPLTLSAQVVPTDSTYTVEYYYKVGWGFADEFIRLFSKNHYPVLRKEMELGRIISVTAATPRYHATEESRWDYRVTIVFRNVAAAFGPGLAEQQMRQLFPDQETFQREEQRRFQILLAHWDVPVQPLKLDTPR